MRFQLVIGQQHIKEKLLQTVQDGRISHAQLFWGAEGSGNLPLALAYAQYLNCTHRTAADSCGVCPSCHKIQKLIHPDLHFAVPVNSTKSVTADKLVTDHFLPQWRDAVTGNPYLTEALWYEALDIENKQGRISVHEATRIIEKLSFKPFESEYKILLLWLPERMGHEAANRLLKLVEEPPDKTVMLFVSESPNHIIKTILSRTMPVHIPPIDTPALEAALQQRENLSSADAGKIARLAGGSYSHALMLMRNSREENEFFEWFTFMMRNAYAAKFLELFEWAEELTKAGREKQKNFLLYAQHLIRESFMLNRATPDVVYLMGEEEQFAQKFSPFVNERNVENIFRELNIAQEHIAQNGNAKMVFTDMFLQIGKLLRK
ncbi:MAG: DNA polymerase III subunit delta [Prevotellaceae bacterium]|jgi:DNA polymerase-3 subunit delta'|nr:DNA polymerase III subunit delta [Prevotellaceae bacterium]